MTTIMAPICLTCKHFQDMPTKLGCEVYGKIPELILRSVQVCPYYEVK